MEKFDVFVIGSGVAGQTVAKACAKRGLKVAIADKREYGGTCSNRGCDPKKVLLSAIEVIERARDLKGKGIEEQPKLNWKKLQKFKKTFTQSIPESTEKNLKALGITLYHQSPKFVEENTLQVEGKLVSALNIVIATGYEPRRLTFKGSALLKKSDDFLNLKKLPKTITFLGAGYVGMEFAHIAAMAGSKVTVIDEGQGPLTSFDKDLVKSLTKNSEKSGIEFIFNAETTEIKKLRKNLKLNYEKDGRTKTFKSRMIINTAGRVPAIAALNLEKGKVYFNENGIKTNGYLQNTGNESVYACGDVSDNGLPLTPLSGMEGHIVAQNILNGNTKKLELPVIPSIVFTTPNLASVGYSEIDAKKRYKNISIKYEEVPNWLNAKRLNAPIYAYKIILNERTDEIIGAHLLGPEANETINLFAMAINQKMTSKAIKKTIFTYPSWANDIKSMV